MPDIDMSQPGKKIIVFFICWVSKREGFRIVFRKLFEYVFYEPKVWFGFFVFKALFYDGQCDRPQFMYAVVLRIITWLIKKLPAFSNNFFQAKFNILPVQEYYRVYQGVLMSLGTNYLFHKLICSFFICNRVQLKRIVIPIDTCVVIDIFTGCK